MLNRIFKPTPSYRYFSHLLVDGLGYEHEGYVTENHKHAIKNMLKHGLTQSDRIIMDKVDLTDNYIRARIKGKVKEGKTVTEVWIREKESLMLVYKNTNDQPI